MKKTAFIVIALFAALELCAQDYKSRYEKLVRNVGYGGVGVETLLDKWEAAEKDNPDVFRARFNFYLSKSMSKKIVVKPQKKYIGREPLVTLKDSLGRPSGYFEVLEFNDSVYTLAIREIDKAIALRPLDLGYRMDKITSLADNGGESPDLAQGELTDLIDYNKKSAPEWVFDGKRLEDDDFISVVQQYCSMFYNIATPQAYESFRIVSEKMNKYYPKQSDFVTNLGTYWLIAKKNTKKAESYYRKALKLNPSDEAAKKNLGIIHSLQSSKGRPSK